MRAREITETISDTEDYLFRQKMASFYAGNRSYSLLRDLRKNNSDLDDFITDYDLEPVAVKMLKNLILANNLHLGSSDTEYQKLLKPLKHYLWNYAVERYGNMLKSQGELFPKNDNEEPEKPTAAVQQSKPTLQTPSTPAKNKTPGPYDHWHEKPDEFDIETAKNTIEEMGKEFLQAEQEISKELDRSQATPAGFTNKDVARILALSLEEPEWFLMAFGPRPSAALAAIAVKKSPEIMRHIEPDLRTAELWLAAVGADPSALNIVNPPEMQEFVAKSLGLTKELDDIRQRRARDLHRLRR